MKKLLRKIEANLLWLFSGIIVGVLLVMLVKWLDKNTIDAIKAIGSILIFISIAIAANQFSLNRKQFENNNKWNKRQLAMTQAHTVLDNINKHIEIINPVLHFRERKKTGLKPYEVYEIHNAMGVFLENGEFVFHSYHTKEHYKYLPKEPRDSHINYFMDDINGLAIKDSIYGLLNEYEYLAAGVNNDILDAEVIKSLMYTAMKDTYKLFEQYIKHAIEKHDGNQNMYTEIKKIIDEKSS